MGLLGDLAAGGAQGLMQGLGLMAKDIREAIVGKEWTPELQADIQKKAMDLELAATNAQMEMIKTEAGSADPWTSRARPAFMYVFYLILLTLGMVAPALGVFYPGHMKLFFDNVALGFRAVPTDLYTLFGAGYLGYVGARMSEKKAGAAR